jgi:hypothetical protein
LSYRGDALSAQRSSRTKTADTAMVYGPMARIKPKITHLSDAPDSHRD